MSNRHRKGLLFPCLDHLADDWQIERRQKECITDPDVAARIRKVYQIAISADSFANMVVFAMSQPKDVDVNEILFRPTRQEY